MKLDFEEIKAAAPLDAVATFLGLELIKRGISFRTRCPNPACKTNNPRAIVITPSTGQWYCFGSKVGGKTPVNFVCHIRGLDPRTQAMDAAKLLADQFLASPKGIGTVPTIPEGRTNGPTPANGKPGIEHVATTLIHEHELVQALDVSPDQAKALGIGFRKSGGSLSGRVLIPVRTEKGEPVCYVGWHPEKDPPLKFGRINLP